jgi:hypothetical protein
MDTPLALSGTSAGTSVGTSPLWANGLAPPDQPRRSLDRAPCTYFLVRSNQLVN